MEQLDVSVYQTDTEVILVGHPEDEDESHNCDAMGCGTDHVLYRFKRDDFIASKKKVLDLMAAKGLDLRKYQKD